MKLVMKRSLLIIGVVCAILLAVYLILKSSIELHESFGLYAVALALLFGAFAGAILASAVYGMIGFRDRHWDKTARMLKRIQEVKEETFKKGYESGLEDGKAQENEEWNKTLNSLTNKIIATGENFDRVLAEEYFANKHLAEAVNG